MVNETIPLLAELDKSQSIQETEQALSRLDEKFASLPAGPSDELRVLLLQIANRLKTAATPEPATGSSRALIRDRLRVLLTRGKESLYVADNTRWRQGQREVAEARMSTLLTIGRVTQSNVDNGGQGESADDSEEILDELFSANLVVYASDRSFRLSADGWRFVSIFHHAKAVEQVSIENWELLTEIGRGADTASALLQTDAADQVEGGLPAAIAAGLVEEFDRSSEGVRLRLSEAGAALVAGKDAVPAGQLPTIGATAWQGSQSTRSRETQHALAAGIGNIAVLDRAHVEQPNAVKAFQPFQSMPTHKAS